MFIYYPKCYEVMSPYNNIRKRRVVANFDKVCPKPI